MTQAITHIKIQNFKAIQDSGNLALTPLTAFIGFNGVGKSSIIEALQTLHMIVEQGLDAAMEPWRGFEHIRNHYSEKRKNKAIQFLLKGNFTNTRYSFGLTVNSRDGDNQIFIDSEMIDMKKGYRLRRNAEGSGYLRRTNDNAEEQLPARYQPGISIASDKLYNLDFYEWLQRWQFISFNPLSMGKPRPIRRTGGVNQLDPSGANIAEYLLNIYRRAPEIVEGIIETLQYILPYARDMQPTLTSELERSAYLQLTESTFKVPGWLLSTGTLRVVALLAVLRHPDPAPVIVIEELENGLDPRTVGLIVEEIRTVIESGTSQVIITTHSPYLLDLLDIDHIVVVERHKGHASFTRPSDQAELQSWIEKYSPGKLYTMGRLQKEATE